MITALKGKNAEIQAKYFSLFDEASKLLSTTLDPDNNNKPYLEPSYAEAEEVTALNYVPNYYYKKVDDNYELASGEFEAGIQYYVQISAIQTLEDYFCHIGTLQKLDRKSKFLMLPIDEDMFEIDANSRTINVPASFRRNGVGVKGDKAAETLLFRINRFFDAVDFANALIFVQWQGVDGTQYVTPIELIDEETYVDESKLVFGWTISEKATEVPGTIKFAIRILRRNEANDITYSFGTLPTTINIVDSLAFDPMSGEVMTDVTSSQLFENAILNSENSIGPSAQRPELLIDLEGKSFAKVTQDANGTYALTLKMTASVTDNGNLSYRWWYRPNLEEPRIFLGQERIDENYEQPSSNHIVERVFELTTDTSAKANKIYYIKNEEAIPVSYEKYNGNLEDLDVSEAYERFSVMTAYGVYPEDINWDGESPITGYYYVDVVNNLRGRVKTETSAINEAPFPNKPEITQSPVSDKIIEENAPLTVACIVDENAEVFYDWKFGLTENTVDQAIEDSNSSTIIADKPGYYKVTIRSRMNLGQAVNDDLEPSRILHPPVAPVFIESDASKIENGEEKNFERINVNQQSRIEPILTDESLAALNNPLLSDGYIYEWYYDNYQDDDSDKPFEDRFILLTDHEKHDFDTPYLDLENSESFVNTYTQLRLKVINTLTDINGTQTAESGFSKLYVLEKI